jgi:glycosyltransferase involved in cell wall biosynthesis
MKTCVIIPTYNEANKIGRLVREVKLQNLDVLVIDDGSSDNTSQIAQNAGAITLRNENNQGKGASLIKGFNYALTHDYEAVIAMDGDGQHLPEDIPYFIRLAKYSDSAIFIGNRMQRTKDMPLARLVTNKFMSWFLSCLAKQRIPDTQCGFRLIKKEVLKRLNLTTSKYETESEILIKGSRLGFRIESVPIKTIYNKEKSQINPFIDTIRFIKLIIRELWTTRS